LRGGVRKTREYIKVNLPMPAFFTHAVRITNRVQICNKALGHSSVSHIHYIIQVKYDVPKQIMALQNTTSARATQAQLVSHRRHCHARFAIHTRTRILDGRHEQIKRF
jgi:hypothetical protein